MTVIVDREHLRLHIASKPGLTPDEFAEPLVISDIRKCGKRLDGGMVFRTCMNQDLILPTTGVMIPDTDQLTVSQLLDIANL